MTMECIVQLDNKPLASSIYRVETGYKNNSCSRNKLLGKCESTVVSMKVCNFKFVSESGSHLFR